MLNTILCAATAILAFLIGSHGWPWLVVFAQKLSANRALADAKALIAKADAGAVALSKARAVVATQPKSPTGTSGPTGA